MRNPIFSQSIPTSELSQEKISEMYDLFQSCYDQTTFNNFTHDLENKNWIVTLQDTNNQQIIGFSTLAFYNSTVGGKTIGVVYSGDTIINKKYWGTPELPKCWIRTVLKLSEDCAEPQYWLLISSGYKTYRFLSVFYKEFYPHYNNATPEKFQRIMDHLAHERFGEDYHPVQGIVRFSSNATPLKNGIADIKPKRNHDEHVKYFIAKNPGSVDGDELVCLTVIHPDNFTPAGKRMAR